MKILLKLGFLSLLNRRMTTLLTLVSIALSVALLVGVERLRVGAKEGFRQTISKTDLIVGARGGPTQLLLYTVFHIGNPANNISWASYEEFKAHKSVKWTAPLSLGDSHRGYRVVGTTNDLFAHYQYGGDQKLRFRAGSGLVGVFSCVLGSSVAKNLHYQLGTKIVLSHGIVEDGAGFQNHADKPFTVVGILQPTGTPLDRSVFVRLEGVEAIHMDWFDGAPPLPGEGYSKEEILAKDIEINAITAFFLGAQNRIDTLALQREINEYSEEALSAIIPGVALGELWDGLGYVEGALLIISAFVVLTGLMGMLISIYHSLQERRREMAILRSLGAGPWAVFTLLVTEAAFLTAAGMTVGYLLVWGLVFFGREVVSQHFGVQLPVYFFTEYELYLLAVVFLVGVSLGVLPALRAYRNTLADGLTIRI